jgi:AmiR/NasT family two-component response regulator
MSGPPVLQNFSGRIGHIITADTRVTEALGGTLSKLGLSLKHAPLVDGKPAIDFDSLRDDRDILFTDSDLHQPLNAREVGSLLSVPVIGIVGIESPSRLKFLIQVGATALLRKPIHAAAIYSALFMGINGFSRQRHLECRLEDQERRQRSRRTIVKAIISLMKTAGIDDDQAYAILRRESMRQQLRIEDYCATVIGADSGNEDENVMVKNARKTASLK